jgi:hypothetical protein
MRVRIEMGRSEYTKELNETGYEISITAPAEQFLHSKKGPSQMLE